MLNRILANVGGLLRFLATACVASALSVVANGQETANLSTAQFADLIANVAKLSAEVRELRAELAQERLERQEETILALRRQLENLRGEKERLDDEERSEGRELQELTERLSQTGLRSDERLQLESVRTALTSSPVRVGAQRSLVAQQEARLLEQLAREQRRHAEITATAKEMRRKQ